MTRMNLDHLKYLRCLMLLILFTIIVISMRGVSHAETAPIVSLNLHEIKNIWLKKCGSYVFSKPLCHLDLSDVIVGADAESILIFRGESGFFSRPATSAFARGYDSSNLKSKNELLNVYNEMMDQPLEEVVTKHLSGEGVTIRNSQYGADPFVSFSTNPHIAESFSDGKVVYLVIIKASEFKSLTKENCRQKIIDPGYFYYLKACNKRTHLDLEAEISAVFFVDRSRLMPLAR